MFLCPFWCAGQSSSVYFEHITDKDGLPLGFTEHICYDKKGLLWIAGWDEIIRYDGYQVERFFSTSEKYPLNIDGRTEIEQAPDGRFYVMDHLKVHLFDPDRFAVDTTYDLQDVLSSLNVQNAHIRALPDGRLWLISNYYSFDDIHHQAYLFRLETDHFYIVDTIRNTRAESPTIELLNDTLYVFSHGAVQRYTSDGKRLPTIDLPRNEIIVPRPYLTESGDFWIKGNSIIKKGDNNLFQLKTSTGEVEKFQLPPRIDLSKTREILVRDDHLWIAGINQRLTKYNMVTAQWEDFDDAISALSDFPYVGSETVNLESDQSGIIWMTTTRGLIKVVERSLPVSHLLSKKDSNCLFDFCSMRGITEDLEGNMYFSYYDNVHKLEKNTGEFYPIIPKNFNKLPASYSLQYLNDKVYWVDVEIDLKSGKAEVLFPDKLNGHVTSCLGDDGAIWFYTWSAPALYKYLPETGKKIKMPMPDALLINGLEANDMKWDVSTKSLWIATSVNGLLQLDIQGAVKTHLHSDSDGPVQMPSNNIKAIHMEGDTFWIGHSHGLCRLEQKSKSIENFHVKNSTNIEVVGIIPENQQFLWVSTNKGLYRFDKKSGNFQGFPTNSIISNKEFNRSSAFKSEDGQMHFGSLNGVISFYPDEVVPKISVEKKSKIVLTRFLKYNSRKKQTTELIDGLGALNDITLTHRDRFFLLEFTSTEYSNDFDHTYVHKLEGYEEQWSKPNMHNQLRYDNLPHGRYALRIRNALDLDFSNDNERIIQINVLQAWYKTWWFVVLCLLVAYGIVQIIFKIRLEQKLKMERIRTKISSDLHDDVGTVLSGLAMQSEILGMTASQEQKSKLNRIGELSRDAMLKMRDIVWAIDSRKDNMENLTDRINEYAQELLIPLDFDFDLQSNISGAKSLPVDVRQNLFLICKEALTNIAKTF